MVLAGDLCVGDDFAAIGQPRLSEHLLGWSEGISSWRLSNGAACMRFDRVDFVAFALFFLNRDGAVDDDPSAIVADTKAVSHESRKNVAVNLNARVAFGLPGSVATLSLNDLRALLAASVCDKKRFKLTFE